MADGSQAESPNDLEARLAALGLTTHALALLAGVSHHTVRGVVTGSRAHGNYVRGPHQSSITKVLEALAKAEEEQSEGTVTRWGADGVGP